MKNIKILNASDALKKLMQLRFSLATALKLKKLANLVDEAIKVYVGEEKKLIDMYAKKDENGEVIMNEQNQFSFASVEDAQKFFKEREEMYNTEIDIEPVVIKLNDIKDGEISPNDLVLLDGIVNFEE
jgi:hypothetical protein